MYPLRFHLSTQTNLDVIHITGHPITLVVYPIKQFHPPQNASEIFWCCDHLGEMLLFVTQGYHPHADPFHLATLEPAIRWYASYVLDNPDLFVLTRSDHKNSKHLDFLYKREL